ncbi:MAG: hypothetical protein V4651_06475 [Bacteroidota bacterium]
MTSLNNIFKFGILLGTVILVLNACKKSEIYPDIPAIEFKSYYYKLDTSVQGVRDTLLGIIIGYKDGDGDIGLNKGDTFAPFNSVKVNDKETNKYRYNLYEEYYALNPITNVFEPVIKPNTLDTLIYTGRVENITPDGKHKAIRGEIDWQNPIPSQIEFPDMPRIIKVRVRIYDRALHESNTVESPEIILP